jgi:hypothetical protein
MTYFISSPLLLGEMGWHVASLGVMKNTYKILVGRSEGKKPHGRSRRSWKGDPNISLKGIGCEVCGVD